MRLDTPLMIARAYYVIRKVKFREDIALHSSLGMCTCSFQCLLHH